MVGYNARGLSTKGKLRSLLQEAARQQHDVLFVQEHNFQRAKRQVVESIARKAGYACSIAYRPEYHKVGGAAVFIRRDCDDIDLSSLVSSSHVSGCLARAKVAIYGEDTNLCSAYLSSDPRLRKWQIGELDKVVSRNTIIQADWNCVADVSRDVQYPVDSNSSYPSEHGPLLESTLTRIGLSDVYRRIHGDSHSGFTRLGGSVFTRIDRFYARKYNSPFRWVSVAVSPCYIDVDSSDHTPVIATLDTVQARKPKEFEEKIDPRILRSPELRSKITHLHSITILGKRPLPEEWDLFKRRALEAILGYQRERNARSNKGKQKILIATYQQLIANAHKVGPSNTFSSKKSKLESEIRKAKESAPPPYERIRSHLR